MTPTLHPGAYAYVLLPLDAAGVDSSQVIATFREAEGLTVILPEAEAARLGLAVAFRAAWITLKVDSDLSAVGFTATFSRVLAEAGISCNVVAAVHHDHLFVPFARGAEALERLQALQANACASARQTLALTAIVVRDYDEAIRFYVDVLGFQLVEDVLQPAQNKRWVVVKPQGASSGGLLLARAANDEQSSRIGNQTGGRVFLFLHTDDFWRDYDAYRARGVEFVRGPSEESHGTVAVFRDLHGNLWDLVEPRKPAPDQPSSEVPR